VDGTIVREPGKTGSQWRILYSIRLPSLVCDFFEVTATIDDGSGESLNRLPMGPHELILADAGYCSVAGIEYVWHHGADVLVRVNPQSFVAYSAYAGVSPSFRDYARCPKQASSANGALSCMVKVLNGELNRYPFDRYRTTLCGSALYLHLIDFRLASASKRPARCPAGGSIWGLCPLHLGGSSRGVSAIIIVWTWLLRSPGEP
jgi:hypothetical protein